MNVISMLTLKAHLAFLYDDFTVRQGLEKLQRSGYTALPVLSREGVYMGTVTEGDFLWSILDRGDNSMRAQERVKLKTILRPDFNPAVGIGVGMEELVERAMKQSFVPVVDDRGMLVGIVTRQSIIRHLVEAKAGQIIFYPEAEGSWVN